MSGANGVRIKERAPMALVFTGARVLVGPCEDHPDGRRVVVAPVYEHQGAIQVGPPNAAGEAPVKGAHQVLPVSGLASLRSMTVTPCAVVVLSALAPAEARDIQREWDACDELAGSLRAQLLGLATPQRPSGLVLPPGVRG